MQKLIIVINNSFVIESPVKLSEFIKNGLKCMKSVDDPETVMSAMNNFMSISIKETLPNETSQPYTFMVPLDSTRIFINTIQKTCVIYSRSCVVTIDIKNRIMSSYQYGPTADTINKISYGSVQDVVLFVGQALGLIKPKSNVSTPEVTENKTPVIEKPVVNTVCEVKQTQSAVKIPKSTIEINTTGEIFKTFFDKRETESNEESE